MQDTQQAVGFKAGIKKSLSVCLRFNIVHLQMHPFPIRPVAAALF